MLLSDRLKEPDCVGLSDADAAALLTTPTIINNPIPQSIIPQPFSVTDIFSIMTPQSASKLHLIPFLPDIRDSIRNNDRAACALYSNLLLAGAIITADEHTQINNIINRTYPDPNWQATISGPSWAQQNLNGQEIPSPNGGSTINQVTPQMVAEARSTM
jgi:hypothetical protein